jgi:hypothetical protein
MAPPLFDNEAATLLTRSTSAPTRSCSIEMTTLSSSLSRLLPVRERETTGDDGQH